MTRRHIPEESALQIHRFETLKSKVINFQISQCKMSENTPRFREIWTTEKPYVQVRRSYFILNIKPSRLLNINTSGFTLEQNIDDIVER
jgi:hypothetical protein